MIVQAAKQRTGRLYVATDDGLVSVKGTIFSVNHGTKGSRVAVIEGVVRVNFGENTTDLTAGQEATSGASVAKVPIQNEIAWSRNSAKYLALLGEFAVLQKQFAAIPGPGLRYHSDLLPYVPDQHGDLCGDSESCEHLRRSQPALPGPSAAKPGTAQLVAATAKRKGTKAGRCAEPDQDVQQLSGRRDRVCGRQGRSKLYGSGRACESEAERAGYVSAKCEPPTELESHTIWAASGP